MFSWLKLHVWNDTQPAPEFASAQTGADHQALAYLVPRKFESLEVWLLLFCGVFGLLRVCAGGERRARHHAGLCGDLAWPSGGAFTPHATKCSGLLGAAVALLLVAGFSLTRVLAAVRAPICIIAVHRGGLSVGDGYTGLVVFSLALVALYFASGGQQRRVVSRAVFSGRGDACQDVRAVRALWHGAAPS